MKKTLKILIEQLSACMHDIETHYSGSHYVNSALNAIRNINNGSSSIPENRSSNLIDTYAISIYGCICAVKEILILYKKALEKKSLVERAFKIVCNWSEYYSAFEKLKEDKAVLAANNLFFKCYRQQATCLALIKSYPEIVKPIQTILFIHLERLSKHPTLFSDIPNLSIKGTGMATYLTKRFKIIPFPWLEKIIDPTIDFVKFLTNEVVLSIIRPQALHAVEPLSRNKHSKQYLNLVPLLIHSALKTYSELREIPLLTLDNKNIGTLLALFRTKKEQVSQLRIETFSSDLQLQSLGETAILVDSLIQRTDSKLIILESLMEAKLTPSMSTTTDAKESKEKKECKEEKEQKRLIPTKTISLVEKINQLQVSSKFELIKFQEFFMEDDTKQEQITYASKTLRDTKKTIAADTKTVSDLLYKTSSISDVKNWLQSFISEWVNKEAGHTILKHIKKILDATFDGFNSEAKNFESQNTVEWMKKNSKYIMFLVSYLVNRTPKKPYTAASQTIYSELKNGAIRLNLDQLEAKKIVDICNLCAESFVDALTLNNKKNTLSFLKEKYVALNKVLENATKESKSRDKTAVIIEATDIFLNAFLPEDLEKISRSLANWLWDDSLTEEMQRKKQKELLDSILRYILDITKSYIQLSDRTSEGNSSDIPENSSQLKNFLNSDNYQKIVVLITTIFLQAHISEQERKAIHHLIELFFSNTHESTTKYSQRATTAWLLIVADIIIDSLNAISKNTLKTFKQKENIFLKAVSILKFILSIWIEIQTLVQPSDDSKLKSPSAKPVQHKPSTMRDQKETKKLVTPAEVKSYPTVITKESKNIDKKQITPILHHVFNGLKGALDQKTTKDGIKTNPLSLEILAWFESFTQNHANDLMLITFYEIFYYLNNTLTSACEAFIVDPQTAKQRLLERSHEGIVQHDYTDYLYLLMQMKAFIKTIETTTNSIGISTNPNPESLKDMFYITWNTDDYSVYLYSMPHHFSMQINLQKKIEIKKHIDTLHQNHEKAFIYRLELLLISLTYKSGVAFLKSEDITFNVVENQYEHPALYALTDVLKRALFNLRQSIVSLEKSSQQVTQIESSITSTKALIPTEDALTEDISTRDTSTKIILALYQPAENVLIEAPASVQLSTSSTASLSNIFQLTLTSTASSSPKVIQAPSPVPKNIDSQAMPKEARYSYSKNTNQHHYQRVALFVLCLLISMVGILIFSSAAPSLFLYCVSVLGISPMFGGALLSFNAIVTISAVVLGVELGLIALIFSKLGQIMRRHEPAFHQQIDFDLKMNAHTEPLEIRQTMTGQTFTKTSISLETQASRYLTGFNDR